MLFEKFCRLIGLYRTMLEIGNSASPEETAARYSYLFLDKEFCDACQSLDAEGSMESGGKDFTELRRLFDWLHYLKAWFWGCRKMAGFGLQRSSGVTQSICLALQFLSCSHWKMTRRISGRDWICQNQITGRSRMRFCSLWMPETEERISDCVADVILKPTKTKLKVVGD